MRTFFLVFFTFPFLIELQAQTSLFECINNQSPFSIQKPEFLFDQLILPNDTVLFGKRYTHREYGIFYHYKRQEKSIYQINIRFQPKKVSEKTETQWGYLKVKVLEDKKLEIISFEPDSSLNKSIKEAIKSSSDWFNKNQKKFDLNSFKLTDRYKKFLSKRIKLQDLNNSQFKSRPRLSFIDKHRSVIGIYQGRNILHKGMRWGHFIDYMLIFNLQTKKIQKVLVYNTGYFLE